MHGLILKGQLVCTDVSVGLLALRFCVIAAPRPEARLRPPRTFGCGPPLEVTLPLGRVNVRKAAAAGFAALPAGGG